MKVRSWRARRAAAAGALAVLLVASMAGEARGSPGWSWPVQGGVITSYSNDDADPYAGGVHRGIDIAAPVGTPVRAARTGEVTYAGALGYSGLTVSVRTVDGYVTSYLHLSAVAVRRGETVDGGTRLGEVGISGRRSKPEPHLHLGVRVAGVERHYVDPLTLLPPAGPGEAVSAAPAPATFPAVSRPAPALAVTTTARVPVARRPAWRPARAPVHLPLPVPVQRPAVATAHGHRAHAVPVAPVRAPAPAPRRIRHGGTAHRPAPAAARREQAARDWGRPLAIGGLGLFVLALFGRSALTAAGRANRQVSGRAYEAFARALRPARAYLPRWR